MGVSHVNATKGSYEINESMITTDDVANHLKENENCRDGASKKDCTSNDNGDKLQPSDQMDQNTKTISTRTEESSKPHIENDGLLSNLHQKMNNMIVESLSFFSVDTETNAADEAKNVLPNPSIVDSSMNSFGHN